jgi:hypothetical protein
MFSKQRLQYHQTVLNEIEQMRVDAVSRANAMKSQKSNKDNNWARNKVASLITAVKS